MKKILLIGDDKRAPYHPLKAVQDHFESALSGLGELTVLSDDYAPLTQCYVRSFDLIVSYADAWDQYATAENNAALLTYVAGGGKLLAVHGGTIARKATDVASMLGAKFSHHPKICQLHYETTENHPIVDGIGPFDIVEEPYRYEWNELAEKQVLLQYTHEGAQYPALWRLQYGLGQIVCFAVGHLPTCFTQPVDAILHQSANWLLEA